MSDRRVSWWLDTLDTCMRICSPSVLLFLKSKHTLKTLPCHLCNPFPLTLWSPVRPCFVKLLRLPSSLRLSTNFFPLAPSFALKRTYSLATFAGGLLRWSMTQVPLGLVHEFYLVFLLSGKAGNTRAGDSPSPTTRSEHCYLLFHPLTLLVVSMTADTSVISDCLFFALSN